MSEKDFLNELASLINRYSLENESNTPDFLLAEFVRDAMLAYAKTVSRREEWFGRNPGSVR